MIDGELAQPYATQRDSGRVYAVSFADLLLDMTSHPEFGEKTSALEVANVFADRIRGKNGTRTIVSGKTSEPS